MPFEFSWTTFATWPAPNYVNPTKRGAELYVVDAIFLALTTITIGIRLYARLWIRRWFGLDDLCICLAWVRVGLMCEWITR
jgi:hypothetical protein